MKNLPLVSIIIPVYNGSEYVKEAIDSALNQTYVNKEILLINDGSCDKGKTEEIALSYGNKIRYFFKENGGVSSALNLGIREMRGEYFSWLSHDDVYDSKKVEKQVDDVLKLQSKGEAVSDILFYCLGSLMDANGKTIRSVGKGFKEGLYSGPDALQKMFKGHMFGGCAFLIPKQMFDRIGGFDEDMRYMQDVFMWEKAFISGCQLYIRPDDLVKTRIHAKQVSATGKAFALRDRERVGTYLAEHLKGLKSSNGEVLLKTYMLLCMRNNSLLIGERIYKDLLSLHELTFTDKLKTRSIKLYGKLRKSLVKMYRRLIYSARRG